MPIMRPGILTASPKSCRARSKAAPWWAYALPFDLDIARTYCMGVIKSVSDGKRILICALVGGDLVCTLQLYLSPEQNAPHWAEIYKLLVHPDYQRQRLGEALMREAEDQARRRELTVLLLETA